MDIVKFTYHPEREADLKAIIDEINTHAALSENEKQSLMEELREWGNPPSEV
ncbi:hypothetical protein [Paenibacillus cremeus]|uniref:hypothetical protein n=1 Tax=Paenibacillus cremeus TaxID=2163881 RepID=UPI0016452E23|nr:hypothetical protein [Paenibacillus cremeus]